MAQIHPQAIVDSQAELGSGVEIGPFSIIEAGVTIGDNTVIGPSVHIASGASIGSGCKISTGAVIATEPQDLKFKNEKTFVVIGNNTTIREYATINRATTHSYYTRVGDNCLLMAYSHVAHDCQLGNNVILANGVAMGGHVVIGDFVGVGGLAAIHQFVHIGAHSFISGLSKVGKDVPPYILAMSEPLTYAGLNSVGLKRRGFDEKTLALLKQAYKIIYRENLTLNEAIEKIKSKIEQIPEIEFLINFLNSCERGLIR